jgi:hypothetical protein
MNQAIQFDKLNDFVAQAEEANGQVPPYVMIGPDGIPIWGQALVMSFLCENMTISNPHVGEFRVTGFGDSGEYAFAIVRVARCGSPEERNYLDELEARAKASRQEDDQTQDASSDEFIDMNKKKGSLLERFLRKRG